MRNITKNKKNTLISKNIALKQNIQSTSVKKKIVYIFIRKTINNIFMTACTHFNKNLIGTYSMGYTAYKGSVRMSPTAFEVSGSRFGSFLYKKGYLEINLVLRSPGFFIQALVRGFQMTPIQINEIIPKYKYGHNGMRGKKLRRV